MTQRPLVSVVTPAFNHGQFLDEYLGGLLSQTYPRIELVYVDDASTDHSWWEIQDQRERLEARFERLSIHRNSANLGLFRTLGRALDMVSGDFVCLLESDDYFYPEKIARNVALLATSDRIGLVHSDVDFLDAATGDLEQAHWRSRKRGIPQGHIYEDLMWENHILTCTTCIRTDAFRETADFERYEAAGYRTADYPLFLALAKKHPVAYIDEPLACYRVVEESISHPRDLDKQLAWKLAYYRVKIDQLAENAVPPRVEVRARSQYHRTRFELAWIRGNPAEVEAATRELERLGPGHQSRTDRIRRRLVRSPLAWQVGRTLEQAMRTRRAQDG